MYRKAAVEERKRARVNWMENRDDNELKEIFREKRRETNRIKRRKKRHYLTEQLRMIEQERNRGNI